MLILGMLLIISFYNNEEISNSIFCNYSVCSQRKCTGTFHTFIITKNSQRY